MSFLSYLINGVSLGSVYAIIALGYTMVYGIAKMLNFAHGDIIMVGGYAAFLAMVNAGLSPLIGVLVSIVVCTLLGVVIERIAYKPLRMAPPLAVLITAIGVSYFLQNLALLLFGADTKTVSYTHLDVYKRQILLSTAGVVMTAGITGAFCYFALRMKLLESLLIGAVISSTDAASVFSILRSKRLNLKDNTASLLEVESGSNDPFSYMLTMTVLSIMSGTAETGGIAYMLFAQIVYGLLGGAVIALLALWFLKNFHFATEGFDTIFVVAVVLLAYAAPAAIGGNGYLSAYVVGILLGNGPLKNKKALVHFFDGITGLMQMLIFFLLGLLAFPSQLPGVVLPALLIALFLTFAARPLAVFAIMTPFRCRLNQQLLVAWSGLRGAASIVFAIMAVVSPCLLYTSRCV